MFGGMLLGSKSVCIKKDSQCAGATVAGNHAACSCDINVVKVTQAFQILVHFLNHFFLTAGVGDEYTSRVCM